MASYTAFLAWFVLLIVFSFVLDFLWSRIFPRHGYRWFITSGIIIHELSHAVACILVRARVTRIRFFAPHGGEVEHGPPKIPIIGRPIIGLAPIFGCSLSLWGLFVLFGYHDALPSIDFSTVFIQNIDALYQSALDFFRTYYSDWTFWLFLYLATSIAASIAPSTVDIKNAIWGIIFLVILGGALIYFNIGKEGLEIFINKYFGRVISLGALMEFFALIVTIPVYFLKKALTNRAPF
ncbi:hypothetical protein KKB10_00645 [Patescibacteria group bacterium]|nr:hypothetical protein [Patescibacteria group bacterium]MBU1951432.1 hypothetical protein [Patescibacteria group bacterium]